MEANAPPLSGDETPAPVAVPVAGELIVQNGRYAGARRPLSALLTLIGRSPGCDIRLNVEDIKPLHCVILQAAGGLVLRDLDSGSGTFVNGQRVTTCLLGDGDGIVVGPYEFRVRWQGPAESIALPDPASRQAEAEALRVQAAAVAAQQAALLEEEHRLQQRRAALEKQEEQLAAHLEERRRGLVAAQEEVSRGQAQLNRERAEFEQERRTRLEETGRDRTQAAEVLQQATRERKRLSELRRRLRRRWKRHWDAHEKTLQRREQEVARGGERLQTERAAFTQARLRFNGESELGKRQIQDGWVELQRAQREWQQLRRTQQGELARKRRELDNMLADLAAGQRTLAAQDAQARAARAALEKEAEGLENRVRNLRNKLAEHEQELARRQDCPDLVAIPAGAIVPPPPYAIPVLAESADTEQAQRLARLEVLAGDLADQRLRLAEQWERFLLTQQTWHVEHASFFPQLEETARRLEDREKKLVEQEHGLAAAAGALHEQQQGLSRLRSHLEGWQARLTAAESAWRNERATLVIQAETAEALAAKRQEVLEGLRKQWAVRRKEEFDHVSRELKRCRETHRYYAELCQELERRSGELGCEQRTLAERKLALEQFQLELVGRSENSAAAEKKISKLRRQLAAMHVEAERRLAARCQGVEVEADRLRAQAHHLNQRVEAILERETALSTRQTEWEHQQAVAQQEHDRQHQELYRLRRQGEIAAQHRAELQDELDRLIRLLLDEVDQSPSVWAA